MSRMGRASHSAVPPNDAASRCGEQVARLVVENERVDIKKGHPPWPAICRRRASPICRARNASTRCIAVRPMIARVIWRRGRVVRACSTGSFNCSDHSSRLPGRDVFHVRPDASDAGVAGACQCARDPAGFSGGVPAADRCDRSRPARSAAMTAPTPSTRFPTARRPCHSPNVNGANVPLADPIRSFCPNGNNLRKASTDAVERHRAVPGRRDKQRS